MTLSKMRSKVKCIFSVHFSYVQITNLDDSNSQLTINNLLLFTSYMPNNPKKMQ